MNTTPLTDAVLAHFNSEITQPHKIFFFGKAEIQTVLGDDGDILFVAKDVYNALGYSKGHNPSFRLFTGEPLYAYMNRTNRSNAHAVYPVRLATVENIAESFHKIRKKEEVGRFSEWFIEKVLPELPNYDERVKLFTPFLPHAKLSCNTPTQPQDPINTNSKEILLALTTLLAEVKEFKTELKEHGEKLSTLVTYTIDKVEPKLQKVEQVTINLTEDVRLIRQEVTELKEEFQ